MMHRRKKEIPYLSTEKVKVTYEENVTKKVILWTLHNIKFLLKPGSKLGDLRINQLNQEALLPKKGTLKRYNSPIFLLGLTLVLLVCTIAIFDDWISPLTYSESTLYTGLEMYYQSYSPPSPEHLLGQTFSGFDILGRIIYATLPILVFAIFSTIIALLMGIVIGSISAYYEGWVDTIAMRFIDIILSFPGVIFAIIFILIWGRGFIELILIYSFIGMPYFARLTRTQVLKEKALPYVTAGKVSGANNLRVIFRHIIPNCMNSLIIALSFNIGRNILSLTVLGFLRFQNVQWLEWGTDISRAINFMLVAPWAVFYPTLMILLTVIGFLLVGDGLSENGFNGPERL